MNRWVSASGAARSAGSGAAGKVAFNVPTLAGNELDYVGQALRGGKFSGDGPFCRRASQALEVATGSRRALLTPSCTAALELAALLIDLKDGDEVITPSFTFVSTANAFVLRGARVVFVDVRADTMNMDESLLRAAITPRTRAIVPVHYAGVSCAMDEILAIAGEHKLWVIEDAAQGVGASYKGRALGGMGHLGALSFHETKNVHCGEGGALLVNDPRFVERAEILREKGTNRQKFLRGEVDKYTWVDVGSSYLPPELSAAFLCAQLEAVPAITARRMRFWNQYQQGLAGVRGLQLPEIPADCVHNGHIFHVRVADLAARDSLVAHLKACDIHAVFHYIPLHASEAGRRHGRFAGDDTVTTRDSERLLRLPMHHHLTEEAVAGVIAAVREWAQA